MLVDLEHLMGYLDDVVNACAAAEDLRDDAAIDTAEAARHREET